MTKPNSKPVKSIRQGRLYVRECIPGKSGYQRWDERIYFVVNSELARNNRREIIGEYVPNDRDYFRLEDGHLPDFQPLAYSAEMQARLLGGECRAAQFIPEA